MLPAGFLLVCTAAAGLAAAQPAGPASENPGASELPGLMDKVLANPENAEARVRLSSAAEQASAQEKKDIAEERSELLAGAARDWKKVLEMRAAKKRRLDAWRMNLARACLLAANVDNVREAVASYEALLESAPVYSDDSEELSEASERIKKIFFKTIKSEYPHLVAGRDRINERDIASLLFARASTLDDFGRYSDTGSTQEVLIKAERFRRLERELGQYYSDLTQGLALYSKRNYAEARGYFEDVLAFDGTNEEALFYWALTKKNAKPDAGGEAGGK